MKYFKGESYDMLGISQSNKAYCCYERECKHGEGVIFVGLKSDAIVLGLKSLDFNPK